MGGISSLIAQDLIITKDSKRIDAQILEISDYEVKYKIQGNQNATIFTIKSSNVASIIFANGEVYTSKKTTPTPMQPTLKNNETDSGNSDVEKEKKELDANFVEVRLKSGRVVMYEPGAEMSRINSFFGRHSMLEKHGSKMSDQDKMYLMKKGVYVYSGKYAYCPMDKNDYSDFIKRTCPSAYKELRKANILSFVSFGLICVGCGMSLSSVFMKKTNGYMSKRAIGMSISAAGLIVGGLGISFFSSKCLKKSIDIFNEESTKNKYNDNQAYFSLSLSPTNVGLSLNF